jgi:hypothetical protein
MPIRRVRRADIPQVARLYNETVHRDESEKVGHLWLAPRHLDDRTKPVVERAFMYIAFALLQVQKLKTSEFRAQCFLIHHQLCDWRPAGSIPELTRCVGFEQHDAAGAQTGDAATVDVDSQRGGKVTEDGQDTVPDLRLDVVRCKVRVHRRDRHTALRREPFGLLKPDA